MTLAKEMTWMNIVLSAAAGLVLTGTPVVAQVADPAEAPAVRTDNRGPGSLNSGPGSLHSGRDQQGERGRRGGDDVVVAQSGDVRQEDRQQDRREDRRADRQQDRREDRRDASRSNAGGELRGLDRADQVAGERGREGRENARAAQMDRPVRAERMERPERPQRPDRPERPEKPERAGRH